ncbi:fructose-specific PTS transporter subunit EIIC [Ancylobacter radicis]|uniref:protein-N(pi)-phosphohistidine--D-fructose phosphotransferase n=1 Tax=Ancylobacter radicis TaxID=2836179 RepID=A0ABS5R7P0_9HYPH|nr:fructose-specific PTS transporter subunit EIIC [Ancylobacter radicis]MBS9477658.1 fructose-specific PTS transporter subunit EIIC [Ancylobacter radicis]
MTAFIAVVGSGETTVHATLAAEALRKAARGLGKALSVELRGTPARLSANDIAGASAVLLVGSGDLDEARFGALPRSTETVQNVLADPEAVITRLTGEAPAAGSVPVAAPATPGASSGRIVAITSCPTGIAHTFMAAEGLQNAAKALGHAIRVETQGSVGAQDALTPEEIAAADLVIIAADKVVELSRFGGKRVFQSPTKPAITDGKNLIRRAFEEARLQSAPGEGNLADAAAAAKAERAVKTGPYKHLMTGVSFMLPFVVAGGLLIAIAFALGGIYAYDDAHKGTLAYDLFQIGAKGAFTLMVPVLAGYIAFSIADRPGLAPGMIGGMVAANLGAGFLGGIVAGFIAGYGTEFLNRSIKLPRNLAGLKPVLILPILGTLLTGLLMIYVVGGPTAQLLAAVTEWLRGMQGTSAIILGIIIGGMMAFDMGGPINKAAYAFSTGLIASEVYTPMAAAMVAGMTPPLGLALAAQLFPERFTVEEREARSAASVLGLAFVTEGAIPFAARDPLRVIPSLVVGSAVAGAISMAIGAELRVPHGGIFVLPIPNAVSHLGGYVVALIAGTLVTTAMLRVLKKPVAV